MKYLVMECTLGYAVVLDSEGRFLRVPNLGYEVGQELNYVEDFAESDRKKTLYSINFKRWVAVAACFCILVLGAALWRVPAGTVRIKINPDIKMTVNRFDRVVKIEGLNDDGKKLIEDYNGYGKTAKQVSDALADKAFKMGYLKTGGHIAVAADSKRDAWKMAMEEKILTELDTYLNSDDDENEIPHGFIIDTEINDDDDFEDENFDDEHFDNYDDRDDDFDDDEYPSENKHEEKHDKYHDNDDDDGNSDDDDDGDFDDD